jgi:hypothetical protein
MGMALPFAMFQFWLGWLVGVGWWKGKGEEGEEEEFFFFFLINNNNNVLVVQ